MTSTRIRMFGWRAGVGGLQRALFLALSLALLAAGTVSCREESARTALARDLTPAAQQSIEPQVTVLNAEALADLLKAARGRVVVVNFWATWCKPCEAEMPELSAFFQEEAANPANNVTFISVCADAPGSLRETVTPFLQKNKVPFPVNVIDVESPDDVVNSLNLKDTGWDGALPATFVFDVKGALRKSWFSDVTREELIQVIKSL